MGRPSSGEHHGKHHGKFDPALAQAAAPLSRDEVVRLAERFRTQDEAHQRQLAERDDLAAAKDAEIERLRAEIAAVHAAQKPVDDHDYSEAETRDRFIDVLLAEAGWPLTDERDREYPVSGMATADGRGYADYVLWGADGLPLAGRAQAHHPGPADRPAAGEAVRRLPGADDRAATRDLLHERLRALALGRRVWIPTPRGPGVLHP